MAGASASIRGITIKLGGDASGLVKSFNDVNKTVKSTEAQLKDVNKLLKLDPGNTELLIQKQQILNKQYTETAKKLEAANKLRDALVADNVGGKNEEKIRAVNREIESLNKELEKVQKNANGFSVLGEKVQAFGDKLKTAGTKIRDVGNSMTMHLTVPLVAVGAAAVKAASDYEENLNKVDVAFGENADVVKDWAKTATESFGLSESHALEATALFGDMATSMGINQREAAKMSTQLAGLAGDLASFKNISQDQAMNALKAVFTGETEALKNLGIVMTQVNLEEFAEKQGLVYKEMSESEKAVLRYNYVLEKSKNAIGDYSRTKGGTANTIKNFREELDNLSVAIGQHLLPVITPIIQNLTQMVRAFGQLDPKVQEAIVKAGLFVAVAGPVVSGIGNMVIGIGNLVGLGGKAISFFTGLSGGATVASAGMKTAAAAATSTAATTEAAGATMSAAGATASSGFIATAAAATGLGGAAALAAASVGAAAIQIKNNWNLPTEAARTAGDYFKSQLNQMSAEAKLSATIIKIAFNDFSNNARTAVTNGMANVKNAVSTGLSSAQSAINTFGNSARNTMQTTWNNISSRTSGAMTTIKNAVSTGWSSVQSTTSNVVGSIKNSTTESWNTLQSNISSAMSTAKNNVATAWTNIQNATNDARTNVKNALSEMTNKVQDFGGSVWTNLKNNVSSAWSGITSTINTALTNIKNAISNTTLKFGSVTIPTFSWSGKNDSEKGTTASIKVGSSTVKYASAMFGGAILKGATIFGAMGDKLLQAGEVGSEVVVGTNSLMNMIARTQRVNSNNQAVVAGISAIYTLLLEYLPESARQQQIVLDTGKLVGALTPSLNRQFGMMIRG